jgi:hypothetical protein
MVGDYLFEISHKGRRLGFKKVGWGSKQKGYIGSINGDECAFARAKGELLSKLIGLVPSYPKALPPQPDEFWGRRTRGGRRRNVEIVLPLTLGADFDQQDARMDSKLLGDAGNDPDGRILLSPLDAAQIAHVDTSVSSERLLREPRRLTQPPDIRSKNRV